MSADETIDAITRAALAGDAIAVSETEIDGADHQILRQLDRNVAADGSGRRAGKLVARALELDVIVLNAQGPAARQRIFDADQEIHASLPPMHFR